MHADFSLLSDVLASKSMKRFARFLGNVGKWSLDEGQQLNYSHVHSHPAKKVGQRLVEIGQDIILRVGIIQHIAETRIPMFDAMFPEEAWRKGKGIKSLEFKGKKDRIHK